MKRSSISGMLILISLLLGSSWALAQYKHPRVVELEKSLSQEALGLLKGRFPQHPFIVTVAIDPLMRDVQKKTSDKLPYYDLRDEEIMDEWDDPALSNAALLTRVKKTVVNVSVPNTLSEDEIGELKAALAKNLSLVDARDTVEIQRRQWSRMEDNQTLFNVWLPLGLAALLLIMAGIWGATWFGAKRLSGSLQEGFREAGKNASASAPSQNMPLPTLETPERASAGYRGGDIRFNDPIKTRETLQAGIQILKENPSFPNLEDMMLLQTFAEEHPASFGAFLVEFPFDCRQRVLSLSYGDTWLQALSEPGEVDNHCIDVLNKCLRITRNELQKDWQHLLITIWRLGSRRADFFKGLPQAEAFSVLSHLPRSLSLQVAREVYPGAWGVLLDPSHTPAPLKAERIEVLCQRALELVPLQNVQMLERYKNQKDLLSYLKMVDPQIEKEIYQASGNLNLTDLRPAFYPVFELSDMQLDALVPRIKVEEWALAMFNVSRLERKKIESRFSDRQRVRYFELLKHFDSQMPAVQRIGDARERVAHTMKSLPPEIESATEPQQGQAA